MCGYIYIYIYMEDYRKNQIDMFHYEIKHQIEFIIPQNQCV